MRCVIEAFGAARKTPDGSIALSPSPYQYRRCLLPKAKSARHRRQKPSPAPRPQNAPYQNRGFMHYQLFAPRRLVVLQNSQIALRLRRLVITINNNQIAAGAQDIFGWQARVATGNNQLSPAATRFCNCECPGSWRRLKPLCTGSFLSAIAAHIVWRVSATGFSHNTAPFARSGIVWRY